MQMQLRNLTIHELGHIFQGAQITNNHIVTKRSFDLLIRLNFLVKNLNLLLSLRRKMHRCANH
uniref:Uncharacterized protein n=1 Tax=Arundo donax TaxID=35708 RepID=A0A0A9A6B0_ARUDO